MNFKKRVNGSWTDTPNYIHNTFTDTITTLPADIYPTGTTATVGLKGNTLQSQTPSPTSPVIPAGCGDLETVGVKAGQYKIPISSAGQTTAVYLGEVETTRRIKKLVLTGKETDWLKASSTYPGCFYKSTSLSAIQTQMYCTHLPYIAVSDFEPEAITISGSKRINLWFEQFDKDTTVEDFKAYLQQQYAAGIPVTIWYVLATPETAVVNEPLRKIGDYADEVSGITIPTIAGANTISIGTTLQPSEVIATYKGWHPVQNVHERTNGAWT